MNEQIETTTIRSKPTFEQLSERVRQWARDRQILQNSTAEAQLEKLEEERQETIEALAMLDPKITCMSEWYKEVQDGEVQDGFGDMLVCIINAAAIAGVDPVEALAHAYEEIKDRTGYLGSDGIFYKDQP